MKSSFFNGINHDRLYSATDFAEYFKSFIGNGVFGGDTSNMQVSAAGGLNLNINIGACFINGYYGIVETAEQITLEEGDGTFARCDLITARLDLVSRDIHVNVIEGDAAASPEYPVIVRDDTCYDIVLAAVKVRKDATEITAADITDTRFDTTLCGIVTGVVDTIDTSDLFAQYQAAWNLLMQSFSGDEQAIIAAYDNLNRIRPLDIGGTNLLLNSAFIGTSNWLTAGQGTAVSTSASVLKVVPVAKAYSGVVSNITANVKSGKHILSVYAKADANTYFGINIQSFDSSGAVLDNVGKGVQLTNDWQQILFAFDINPSAVRIMVRFSNSKSERTTPFYVKQPKLEIGTEVTDWSPSPYDTPVGVQRGTVTLTPSGNKQVPVNVQFAVPYKVAPSIAASSSGYKVGVDITSNPPIVYNKTTTGFTVNSQYANAVTVDWVAVGEYDTTLPTVTITSQPQNMSAANGASATCSVAAEGTNLSYQWLFSADGGATWLTSSCKTAQYTVVAQTQYNGWLYRCRVTNGAGVSVLSDAATLTVTD